MTYAHRFCLPIFFLFVLFVFSSPAPAWQPPVDNPIEVGLIRWQRDFPAALKASAASGKPVFLLFQEVPGCIGCQTFGKEVLSEPLLVEAVEDNFLPVLVYNNRSGGMDEQLLNQFAEPAWNFQVIRFLNAAGKDLIPRKDLIWTVSETAARMVEALDKAAKPVPEYLRNLVLEEDKENLEQIAFAMACFWTGEYSLGKIAGVVTTEAGWYEGREVTVVGYNRRIVGRDALIAKAAAQNCARKVYLQQGEQADAHGLEAGVWQSEKYRIAAAADQKKQLQASPHLAGFTAMTPMQRAKMNALLPDDRRAALQILSPQQRELLGEQGK